MFIYTYLYCMLQLTSPKWYIKARNRTYTLVSAVKLLPFIPFNYIEQSFNWPLIPDRCLYLVTVEWLIWVMSLYNKFLLNAPLIGSYCLNLAEVGGFTSFRAYRRELLHYSVALPPNWCIFWVSFCVFFCNTFLVTLCFSQHFHKYV